MLGNFIEILFLSFTSGEEFQYQWLMCGYLNQFGYFWLQVIENAYQSGLNNKGDLLAP